MKLRKRIPLVATPSGGVGHAARRTNTTAAGRTEPALAATKVLCPPVQVSSGWTSGRSQSRQAVSESASVWEMAKRGRRSVGIELFLSTSPVWGTTANMTKKALELRQHLQQKDMVYKMISAFLYNLHLLARHFDTVLPLVSVRTGLWFAVCLVVALKLRKAIYRKCGDYTKWWLQ